jgi:hypothetical protein
VKDGVTGFVCAGPSSMADAIIRLQADPALADSMRQAARRRALEASWEQVFERLYDAYRSAARAPRTTGELPPASGDLTVVARAVRGVFRLLANRPAPSGPLAPSAGAVVTP